MAITRSMSRNSQKKRRNHNSRNKNKIVKKKNKGTENHKGRKQQHTSNKRVDTMFGGYLCDELLSEIFKRLPLKSLIRLRSLSKSWCSRIASPYFIHMYSPKTTSPKLLIRHQIHNENKDSEGIYTLLSNDRVPLCPTTGSIDVTAVKVPDGNSRFVGSSNGILCLFDPNIGISLWNYSVRRKLAVPEHPSLKDSTKSIALGFGFDPKTNDYKIVGICYSRYQGAAHNSFLYSMKTNSWNKIASPSTTSFYIRSKARFLNGAVHWVAKCTLNESSYRIIMTFDFSTHVFGTISLPDAYSTRPTDIRIIDGSLAVISDGDDDNIRASLRIEENNIASWSEMENVVYKQICSCDIASEIYVESLELLDKGTPFGETVVSLMGRQRRKR